MLLERGASSRSRGEDDDLNDLRQATVEHRWLSHINSQMSRGLNEWRSSTIDPTDRSPLRCNTYMMVD